MQSQDMPDSSLVSSNHSRLEFAAVGNNMLTVPVIS